MRELTTVSPRVRGVDTCKWLVSGFPVASPRVDFMSACGFVIRWQWLSMPDSQHLGSPVNDSRLDPFAWPQTNTSSGSNNEVTSKPKLTPQVARKCLPTSPKYGQFISDLRRSRGTYIM